MQSENSKIKPEEKKETLGIANIPNFISLLRLLMAPVAVFLIVSSRYVEAFTVFALAGASDAVDGFIARRYNLRSELGAYLDPLADKALLISIFATLAIMREAPLELAILVISRDVMIVCAVILSWLMFKPVTIRPLLISKLNTLAQIAFAVEVLGARAFAFDVPNLQLALAFIAGATTIASGAVYVAQWLGHMS